MSKKPFSRDARRRVEASLLIALLVGFLAPCFYFYTADAEAPDVRQWIPRDPLALIADRSPGRRTGALMQTKPDRVERIASRLREEPTAVPLAALPEIEPPPYMFVDPATPLFLTPVMGLTDIPDPAEKLVAIQGYVPNLYRGFLFGGGRSPFGPGDPGPAPEPATWATMLIGFFALGSVLRRRNSRRHA